MNVGLLEEEKNAFIKRRVFLEDFVLPDYENFNVRNLASIVGEIYSVQSLVKTRFPEDYMDDFGGVEKVFLIIADGLGYNRLLKHLSSNDGVLSELAQKGVLKPLTSTFPATTSTALTSIFTGLQPAEHRVLGYQMFSREYGCVFNTLDMKPVFGYSSHVDLTRDFTRRVKPWMFHLQENGVRTLVATKATIVGSGLSRIIHADQEFVPYMLDSEMMTKCRKTLEQHGRTLLMLYYSGVDALEHRYGPASEEVASEIQSFDYHLKNFISKLSDTAKKETMIILTSDHGVADTEGVHYVKDHAEIADSLMLPPVGDSRAAFLFSKPERAETLRTAFEKNIGGFRLLPSKQLIENGAYGKPADSPLLETLVGDFTALSNSRNVLQYPYFEEDRERMQLGAHGGMTAEEVVVPLLSARLSKF